MTIEPITIGIYDEAASVYDANRPPRFIADAIEFAAPIDIVADLGCGPGAYLPALGPGSIGVDASRGMLQLARRFDRPLVQADLGALPFRPGALHGGWARNSYLHVPHDELPRALADLHRAMPVGAPVRASFLVGRHEHVRSDADDDLPGRHFWIWDADELRRTFVGAGFDGVAVSSTDDRSQAFVHANRARTLPDTVGPGMRVLVSGLNPSLHAADAGVGFITANNRFWPAAIAAGLATADRDPWHALAHHGMGMTDVVKRATRKADELDRDEYRSGVERLDQLCARLRPAAVCMVGLAGWRAAVDRKAQAGWQPRTLGGCPVYVMPSTSGLNAHSTLDDLTHHLRAAKTGP